MQADAATAKGILFDLDGVLWCGDRLIPGARETITHLKEKGFHVRFVTNNSLLGVDGMVDCLERFEIPVARDEVFLATQVLACEIASRESRATVYLIGSNGFKRDLEEQGLRVIEVPEEIDYLTDYVVVGGDWNLNFTKLTRALRCLLKGAHFAVPNTDPTYPSADGLLPGNGAVVAAVSAMVKRNPDLMVGKPNPDILNAAVESMGLSPEECIMVGDSLDSDICAAERAGIFSVLVLTGNSSRADVDSAETKPSVIVDSITDVTSVLGA